MHARWLLSLGIGLAVWTPAAASQTEKSFSLDELRAIARSAHPTLESADAAAEVAVGTLRQAAAYPNPEIVLGVGRGRPRGGGAARAESLLEFAQPIERPGVRRWRTRSAELSVQGTEFERVLARTVVDSAVSRLAYTILLAQRRAEIAEESAEIASRLQARLERRVELGESSPLEALKARSEWFARRRVVIESSSALATARFALDLFCDDRLPERFAIAATLEGPGPFALPEDLRQRLRTHNPTLLRARSAEEEARARTHLARKEVLPGFDVVASRETELDRTATSLAVGLTIPLWDRKRGGIAGAAAEQARTTADTRAIALRLERSLEQASEAYRAAHAAIRLHDDGWTATAREALDISTFSFENGEASLLDVLDAQRSYLGVRSAEAESWAALAFARTDIERLLAGPLVLEDTDESR